MATVCQHRRKRSFVTPDTFVDDIPLRNDPINALSQLHILPYRP